jgi:hypothetical protein
MWSPGHGKTEEYGFNSNKVNRIKDLWGIWVIVATRFQLEVNIVPHAVNPDGIKTSLTPGSKVRGTFIVEL